MSNPTREEIIKAHKILDHLIDYDLADAYTEADKEEVYEHEQLIRKFLPPYPQPTMAETQWDEDKHRLAEAEYVNGGTVMMLTMHKKCDEIKCLTTADDSFRIIYLKPDHLILTGKRYILAEVEV